MKMLKACSSIIFLMSSMVATAQVNVPNGSTALPAQTLTIPIPAAYPSGTIASSVRTHTLLSPIKNETDLPTATDKIVTVYTDGLGRPIQTVNQKATPILRDVIQPVYYDSFGRQPAQVLPYANNDANGRFKINPFSESVGYNGTQYPGESGYYAVTSHDDTSLYRATKVMKPGANGAGTGKGVTSRVRLNKATEDVRLWEYSSDNVPNTSGSWADRTLFVTENIAENGIRNREYKDKEGKTILTKTELIPGLSNQHAGWLCTYYVYDDMERLRHIITPKVVDSIQGIGWGLDENIMNDLCYTYDYDERGRVVRKKIPGQAALFIVYDEADRPVLVQDGNMHDPNQWAFVKYDILGRKTVTGKFLNSSGMDPDGIAADMKRAVPWDLFITWLKNPVSVNQESTTSSIPDAEIYTLNYYDDYRNIPAGYTYDDATVQALPGIGSQVPTVHSNETMGMPTGGYIRIMDGNNVTGNWISSVLYYDTYGRMIQGQSTNFKGGLDTVSMSYNFAGAPIASLTSVGNPSSSQIDRVRTFSTMTYDYAGRPIALFQKVNDEPNYRQVSRNTYDDMGRIKRNAVGAAAEMQDFTYRVWGALEGINKGYAVSGTGNRFFGELIHYDYGYGTLNTAEMPSGLRWRMKGSSNVQRSYGYLYDAADRLTTAYYTQSDSAVFSGGWSNTYENYTTTGMNYDGNGNILKMQQWGTKLGQPAPFLMDNLTYKYASDGMSNRLQAVNDGIGTNYHLGEFNELGAAGSGSDYNYDENGNATSDVNRDITGITYNYLNKPLLIQFASNGGRSIRFTYDAAGNVLSKIIEEEALGLPQKQIDYLGGLEYQDDTLTSIAHPKGRVRPVLVTLNNNTSQWGYEYDYFIKDHMGNVRSVITEEVDSNWWEPLVTSGLPDLTPCEGCKPAPGSNGGTVLGGYTMGERIYTVTNELANAPLEEATFDNVAATRDAKPASSNPYDVKATKLNEGEGKIIGPSIMLKVAAGDKITINTGAYYDASGEVDSTSHATVEQLVGGLISALVGEGDYHTINEGGISPEVTGGALSQSQFVAAMQELKLHNQVNTHKPQAFLNYLLLDEQMNVVGDQSGFLQTTNGGSWNTLNVQEMELMRSGFVVVFLSNESAMNVHFDNLNVVHYKGKLLEENHYYPYGLTLTSKAFTGAATNNKLYAGKELHRNEFSDGTGLEWSNFGARQYDPQIGMWHSIDPLAEQAASLTPYHYCNDNPVAFADPTGMRALPIKARNRELEELNRANSGIFGSPGGGGGGGVPVAGHTLTGFAGPAGDGFGGGGAGGDFSSGSSSGYGYTTEQLINGLWNGSTGDVSLYYNMNNGNWSAQTGGVYAGGLQRLSNNGYSFTAGFFYGTNADGSPAYDQNGIAGSFETVTVGGDIGTTANRDWLKIANDVMGQAGNAEAVLAAIQLGMIQYRQSLPILARVGTFAAFYSRYAAVGRVANVLGKVGNAGSVLDIGLNYHAMTKREISPQRFAYRTVGDLAAIGVGAYVGAQVGGPYGALAGAAVGGIFYIGENSYDGLQWYGKELSIGSVNFESSFSNWARSITWRR